MPVVASPSDKRFLSARKSLALFLGKRANTVGPQIGPEADAPTSSARESDKAEKPGVSDSGAKAVDAAQLAHLLSSGIDRTLAERALRASNGRLDLAMLFVFQPPPSEIDAAELGRMIALGLDPQLSVAALVEAKNDVKQAMELVMLRQERLMIDQASASAPVDGLGVDLSGGPADPLPSPKPTVATASAVPSSSSRSGKSSPASSIDSPRRKKEKEKEKEKVSRSSSSKSRSTHSSKAVVVVANQALVQRMAVLGVSVAEAEAALVASSNDLDLAMQSVLLKQAGSSATAAPPHDEDYVSPF